MPLYEYRCPEHGDFEQFNPVSEYETPFACPECGELSDRIVSLANTPMAGYDVPLRSNAMGINPKQVADASRRFPHRKYDSETGERIFHSHHERSKALKEEGFHDNDGYSGGPSK